MASSSSVPSLKRPQDSPDDSHSRKRLRTSPEPTSASQPNAHMTPEERKEARAHRNRIAAQNSRDRRKAQFTYLEQRVAELEEENRMLRAGIAIPPVVTPTPADLERESARERENQELRERIKTLEKGWDAVLKALTAQGLPTTLSTTTTPTTPTVLPQVADKPAPPVVPDSIPALSPSMFPLSPAPTQASLDFDIDLSLPTALSPEQSSASSEPQQPTEPTRHLARVATTKASLPLVSLQRVDSKRSAPSKAFKLVHEIICAPTSPTFNNIKEEHHISLDDSILSGQTSIPPLNSLGLVGEGLDMGKAGDGQSDASWIAEEEMQKILGMLPIAFNDIEPQPELNLDISDDKVGGLWSSIGVF